ncbi:transport and Golgi organization protein 1 homolog [Ochotona curzoniae]|uniref:transport and Golgi organization protein 1 homolog n=1 Tax=Ochotona curzoniae TaxID=130825 RepID=UPI001B34F9F4|nr:transport and Golgi organization protein 1 homolog [Ochotona curzoniae]
MKHNEEVNMQQISQNINNGKKKIEKRIQKNSVLEQKDDVQKCDNTENPLNEQMQSTRNLKFGEQNDKDKRLLLAAEDGIKDLQLRTLRILGENKKNLEINHNTFQSVKAIWKSELKLLDMNMNSFSEIYKLKMAIAEKKWSERQQEWIEKQRMLSAKEENVKQAEEIQSYKRRLNELQAQQQQQTQTFRQEVAVQKQRAHNMKRKAQALEKQLTVQRRETAHLRHRLEILHVQMREEKYRRQKPVPVEHAWENSPRADPGTCASSTKNIGSFPAENTRKGKVNMATGGPPPFPKSPHTVYYMGGPRSSFMCYVPPPPVWWSPRPLPHLAPEFGEPF